jgi:hypothetical protein
MHPVKITSESIRSCRKLTNSEFKTLDYQGGDINTSIIECLRQGEPLDQNVYEGCFWSAVGPLSEKSVSEVRMPRLSRTSPRVDGKILNPSVS